MQSLLSLNDCIREEHIAFLNCENRNEAIHLLTDLLVESGTLVDRDEFLRAILSREAKISTGIGMGIGIPHAKLDSCEEFFISIGIHQGEGIEWGSIDGVKVKLIFLIGGPSQMHQDYLNLLSKLTQTIKDEKLRLKLQKAQCAEEVIQIIRNNLPS